MLSLQKQGCHNINFVTPEHVVPQIVAVYQQSRQSLPFLTRALIGLSALLTTTMPRMREVVELVQQLLREGVDLGVVEAEDGDAVVPALDDDETADGREKGDATKGKWVHIGGLVDGQTYFVIREGDTRIKLAITEEDAAKGTAINLTSGVPGTDSETQTFSGSAVNGDANTIRISGIGNSFANAQPTIAEGSSSTTSSVISTRR